MAAHFDDDDIDQAHENVLYPVRTVSKQKQTKHIPPTTDHVFRHEVTPEECVSAVGFEHIYTKAQLPTGVALEMTAILRQLIENPMDMKTADVKLYIRRIIGLREFSRDRDFGEFIERHAYFGYIRPIDDEKILSLPVDEQEEARPECFAHECISYEICNRSIDFARRVIADSLRQEGEWITGREAENETCRSTLVEDMLDAQSFLHYCSVVVLKEWTELEERDAAAPRKTIQQLMLANSAYRLWAKGWMAKWCAGQPNQSTADQINSLKRAAIHFEACYKEMGKLEPIVSLAMEGANHSGEQHPLENHCKRINTVLLPSETGIIPDVARNNFEDAKLLDITWCHLCKLQWLITMGDALWMENKRGVALSLWCVAIKNGGVVTQYRARFEENLSRMDTQDMVLEPLKYCSFNGAKCADPRPVDVNECIELIKK